MNAWKSVALPFCHEVVCSMRNCFITVIQLNGNVTKLLREVLSPKHMSLANTFKVQFWYVFLKLLQSGFPFITCLNANIKLNASHRTLHCHDGCHDGTVGNFGECMLIVLGALVATGKFFSDVYLFLCTLLLVSLKRSPLVFLVDLKSHVYLQFLF